MTGSLIIAVLVVSSTGAALAALVSIAEYFLANYGPCRVTINDDREIVAEGGQSLLTALIAEKIFIPSACGGRSTCGLCKLKVLDGAGPTLPTEEPFLDPDELAGGIRLSCQVKLRNDVKIEIPEELFSIREYTATCTEITELTYDTRLFRFKLIEPATITYTPGQYVQLLAPAYEKSDEPVYRAYSLASDPTEEGIVELIIRLVPGGICTTYCFEHLKVGDAVKFNGPYGDFRLSETDAPIVFIAGGSGMAPIRCMLSHMTNNALRRKAVYFFGANTAADLFMHDEMKSFEDRLDNFKYIPGLATPPPDYTGETGLVTEILKRNLTDPEKAEAYLCGSPGMIEASIKTLNDMGMTDDRIFYDKFE